mmetsp:Transcript_7596/g.13071  ORF Transcript_7596/g.13071 Transcript_7596/m.13071 type:complete len:285 (-) Transcript_7596:245-1099(-)
MDTGVTDNGTRRRGPKASQTRSDTSNASDAKEDKPKEPTGRRFNWLLWLLFIVPVLAFRMRRKAPNHQINDSGERYFTKAELAEYSAGSQETLYLSILGHVFDVTKGRRFYGGEGGYSGFSGKDATRAFISGAFDEDGLVEDVEDLTNDDILSLLEWREFYHKEYTYLGKVIDGIYFDSGGEATKALDAVQAQAVLARGEVDKEKAIEKLYPNCNSRWTQADGGKIWCTAGHPRKTFVKQRGGETVFRCACYLDADSDPERRQLYPNCEPEASTCQTSPPPPKG